MMPAQSDILGEHFLEPNFKYNIVIDVFLPSALLRKSTNQNDSFLSTTCKAGRQGILQDRGKGAMKYGIRP
jgi:hypothetical protein